MIVLPATSMIFAPAGIATLPLGPRAVMRLDDLVPFQRDDAGAAQDRRAFRARARRFHHDVGHLGLVRADVLAIELRAPGPGDGLSVGGPGQIVAPLERHLLHRDRGGAARGDARRHGFLARPRNGDQVVLVLQADESLLPVGRELDLFRRRLIGTRIGARAGDLDVRLAVETVEPQRGESRLSPEANGQVDALRVPGKVREATTLRRPDQRRFAAAGRNPAQFEAGRSGKPPDFALLPAEAGRIEDIGLRHPSQIGEELIRDGAGDEDDLRAVG